MVSELKLLGRVFLQRGDDQLSVAYRRTLLLATYLLCQDDWQNREELQLLFWPEDDSKQGGNKLRQLLYRTKQEIYAEAIEFNEDAIRLEIDNDVQKFRSAFADNKWQDVVSLYQGELLSGIQAKGLDGYQEWLDSERNDLKYLWREASLHFANALGNSGQHTEAAKLLKEVLEKDFLDEDILQAYIQQLSLSGHHGLALKYYEDFKRELWNELQLEPLEETQQLAASINASSTKSIEGNLADTSAVIEDVETVSVVSSDSLATKQRFTLLGNVPTFTTPFVGRDKELTELTNFFQDESCRLQTVLGFGGVGKTRLAVELYQRAEEYFVDGAVYVALATIADEKSGDKALLISQVCSLLLQALGIHQSDQQSAEELKTRLLAALKEQETLIVLDNFEHVILAKELIVEILDVAPKVQVLITSREALGLYNEHIYDLSGLATPPLDSVEQIEIYDAVQLFIRNARRIKTDFVLTDDSKPAVAKICNLLQGSPLALELASVWIRLMTPKEIAEELSRNLDILESDYPDLPQRHRSLEAVFEHSWELLSQGEQQTLQRLAIFEGGFSKDAAVNITNVSLRSMFSLANKSLLKRNEAGRYSSHLVVEQYSRRRLLADEMLHEALAKKHASYYATWIKETIETKSQNVWIEEISENYSNFEAALRWAEASQENLMLLKLARSGYPFWKIRSHYIDVDKENWYSKALKVNQPEDSPEDYVTVLNSLAFLLVYKRPEEAEAVLQEAIEISEKANLYAPAAEAYTLQAYTSLRHRSEKTFAYDCIEKALEAAKASKDEQILVQAQLTRSLLYIQDTKYDSAKIDTENCLKYYENQQDDFGRSACLNRLGLIAIFTQQYEDAIEYYLETLTLNRQINNQTGIALSCNNIGFASGRLGNYDEAVQYLFESLKICKEQNLNAFEIATHNSLGMVTILKKDFNLAEKHYHTALVMSVESDNFPNLVEALEGLATLELRTKAKENEGIKIAAQMFAVAEKIRDDKSLPLAFSEQELIGQSILEVKNELGKDQYKKTIDVINHENFIENIISKRFEA